MAEPQLKTNRDLYLFICGLRDVTAYGDHDLEQYLRALWQLGTRHRAEEVLSLGRFAELLESAFRESAPAFDPVWRNIADACQTKFAELLESALRESATAFDDSAWRDIADAGFEECKTPSCGRSSICATWTRRECSAMRTAISASTRRAAIVGTTSTR